MIDYGSPDRQSPHTEYANELGQRLPSRLTPAAFIVTDEPMIDCGTLFPSGSCQANSQPVGFRPLSERRLGLLGQKGQAPHGAVIVRQLVKLRNAPAAISAIDRHRLIVARELQNGLHALPP
jgi:hypothetical protein